jgi:hypothetical protein
MNDEFKKLSQGDVTRYVLESATSMGSGSIASMPMSMGGMQRRKGDNLIAQEADKKTVPASTPRNFVAKNAKTAGAGAHKDKSKTIPRKEKHKKPFMENFNGEYDDEAGMAQSNLITTARAVMGLLKTIKDRDNLPEWGQEKIAKAEMMLVSVWDYLQSQKAMGNDPQQGVAEGNLKEFAPGGNSASSYYAVTANFVNDFAQQKQEELQDLIDAGWTKQDLAQAGTLQSQAADIVHFEQVRDGFLKGLKPGFDAYLQGDTQLKDQLGSYWEENDLPLNQDWEKIYGEPWGRDEYDEGVAEGSVDQLPTHGADYSKYDTDHLKMMLRPGILHRNEARFKALIRKELQKREQQSQQGVAEGDAYIESLQTMMERQLEPTMDLDAWVDNFQNADPQKYHQFKNKTPEKKK